MPKICDLPGIREYNEERTVELWQDENGRLTIVAFNEGGHNSTSVDLSDLLAFFTEVVQGVIAETQATKDQP